MFTQSQSDPTSVSLSLFFCSLFKTAFCSMVEGKNEEMSTHELSGGARIHYIFQSIFVKSLEVCIFVIIYNSLLICLHTVIFFP